MINFYLILHLTDKCKSRCGGNLGCGNDTDANKRKTPDTFVRGFFKLQL